jgi:hypothetical protein
MVFPIAEGRRYAIDSAQGTPCYDLKRTVLRLRMNGSVSSNRHRPPRTEQ